MREDKELSLKSLIAFMMADIDIFLLQEENQIDDKDKLYTKEEIRQQLENTTVKFISILNDCDCFMDLPIVAANKLYSALIRTDISDSEILEIRKNLLNQIKENMS